MLKIGKEFPFLNLGYVPIASIGLKVNLAKMLLKEVQNLLKVGMRVTQHPTKKFQRLSTLTKQNFSLIYNN